jgi:hypothetical protein
VVQHAAAGAEQRAEMTEVAGQPGPADVLEHPHAADRVERAVVDVTLVLNADLHAVGHAGLGDPLRG